jgi:hypothetical protein
MNNKINNWIPDKFYLYLLEFVNTTISLQLNKSNYENDIITLIYNYTDENIIIDFNIIKNIIIKELINNYYMGTKSLYSFNVNNIILYKENGGIYLHLDIYKHDFNIININNYNNFIGNYESLLSINYPEIKKLIKSNVDYKKLYVEILILERYELFNILDILLHDYENMLSLTLYDLTYILKYKLIFIIDIIFDKYKDIIKNWVIYPELLEFKNEYTI